MYWFALICTLFTPLAAGCELVVRFENYAAQSRLDSTLKWHGLDVDFARALLEEAGCGYQFINVPWGRALKMLAEGKLDMVLSVTRTPEREQFAYFIGPQRMETIVFAMSRSRPFTVNTLSDLFALPVPVAIQKGAFYGRVFNELLLREQAKVESQRFIYVADNQRKLSLLKHGRIAGFLEEKFNVLYQSQHNPDFAQITVGPLVVNREPVYYSVSKQSVSAKELQQLQAAFERLQHSGRLKQILAKYGLD
ncbi:ABC transporter substrate-binding protein [Pseudoalteromonas rubra]|uniref:ABC transporter substrate-binding protein n=1 Tax=Pseudoalteromonas rubra TaxID=43658 RepID=A0A5S3WR42_9GAMM|nr:transporter substrate-binding domain-containing protein [Pseudoalteromonas rubra]TMP30040.1 ABC transporter substrate-binding protein [Pseudoalteromonas rubra]TMP35691.1 ABC transporter substrate-binding protein [Pseudoalteromonas rubra]